MDRNASEKIIMFLRSNVSAITPENGVKIAPIKKNNNIYAGVSKIQKLTKNKSNKLIICCFA
jgi:predicted Zn-ribbon and HTH transcriptional regulator